MAEWTKEEIELADELIKNMRKVDDDGNEIPDDSQFIDWDKWAKLKNISSTQAAYLAHLIDPRKFDDGEYGLGLIPKALQKKISSCIQKLENQASLWSLKDLVSFLGDNAPNRMTQVVANKELQSEVTGDDEIKKSNKSNFKILKPIQRVTTESLDLIYQYLKSKGIKPGDIVTISAKAAWGEIHSGKFETNLVSA